MDEFIATIYNEPWGSYNLCLYSDHQSKYTGWEPPEIVPQAARRKAAGAADPGPPANPHAGSRLPGESTGGQQTWVTHFQQTVACTPFHVDVPPRLRGGYPPGRQRSISASRWPSAADRLSRPNTGYLTGTHPVKIRQTITQTAGPAEHGHQRGRGQLLDRRLRLRLSAAIQHPGAEQRPRRFYPLRTIKLTDAGGLGPSPRGVDTDFPTALTKSGKIGPFLSFQDAMYKPPDLVVPFTIWFNNNLEVISAVTVTLPSGGTMAGHPPGQRTRTMPRGTCGRVNLNVNIFPAGQVSATVTAFGHYKDDTSTCPRWTA